MTDTTRTTVTQNKSYMKLIEELVDVFGTTKAQVISNIVEYFFNDSKNDPLLEKLRARKRKEKPPEQNELIKKIRNYLKISDQVPFDVFIDHLDLDADFVVNQLDDWAEKFDLLKGRFELLNKEKPSILLDSADNLDAYTNLFLGVRLLHYQKPLKGLALILGFHKSIDNLEALKLIRYLGDN